MGILEMKSMYISSFAGGLPRANNPSMKTIERRITKLIVVCKEEGINRPGSQKVVSSNLGMVKK